jgi:hypothetical protein
MATRRGPDLTVRVSIQGSAYGNPFANVFWCQLTTGSTIIQADLDTWLTNFQAAYKTNFAPVTNNGASYVEASCTLFQPGGLVLHSATAMTGAGTEAGAAIDDASASKCLSWTSSVYWRGGKPRTYLPAVTQADSVNGVIITAAAQTALKAAGVAFITAVNALTNGTIATTKLGFVSFRSGNVDRPAPLFFEINSALSHPRLGTQRRRLGKWKV